MSTQSKSYLLVRLVLRSSTIFKKASFVLSSAGLKTGLPATRKPRLRRGGIVVLLDCAICGVCLCEESMVNVCNEKLYVFLRTHRKCVLGFLRTHCDRKALIEKLYVFLRTHCDRKVAMCSCEHIAIEKLYTKSIESIYGLEKLYVFLRLLKSRILRLPVLFLHRKALCVQCAMTSLRPSSIELFY